MNFVVAVLPNFEKQFCYRLICILFLFYLYESLVDDGLFAAKKLNCNEDVGWFSL